ncbi:MAG: hypothetical protein CVV46_03685 [Spirochaetae bacterium HGW-Spirochaetae-2]|jgi:coenzyme F420-reducing hydrogenase alpha subunit|nr:MAG: hypothetical protein CVV46_03685 [Spirochaetae bacterium HGW-Spirochaetae-2]
MIEHQEIIKCLSEKECRETLVRILQENPDIIKAKYEHLLDLTKKRIEHFKANQTEKETPILFERISGYEHYAPYFINGDPSGLNDKSKQDADEFIRHMKWEFGDDALIVSADDQARFSYPEYGGQIGSVINYTVAYTQKERYR